MLLLLTLLAVATATKMRRVDEYGLDPLDVGHEDSAATVCKHAAVLLCVSLCCCVCCCVAVCVAVLLCVLLCCCVRCCVCYYRCYIAVCCQ